MPTIVNVVFTETWRPAAQRRRPKPKRSVFRVRVNLPGDFGGRVRGVIPEALTYHAKSYREAAEKAHEWLVSYGITYYGAHDLWRKRGVFYRVTKSRAPKGFKSVRLFDRDEFLSEESRQLLHRRR